MRNHLDGTGKPHKRETQNLVGELSENEMKGSQDILRVDKWLPLDDESRTEHGL